MVKEKSGSLRKKRKVREKARNFDRLSQYKGSSTSRYQLDDLRFCQNATSRSQRKLSEVREKSGKSQGKIRENESGKKWSPCLTVKFTPELQA